MIPETPDWAKFDILSTSIALFVVVIIAEIIYTYRKRISSYEYRDTAASLFMGLISLPIDAVYATVHIVLIFQVYDARVFTIGWTWWALILCFFLEDMVYYWGHRLSHEIRLWWASHVIHHSSQHYNGVTALRQSWTGIFGVGMLIRMPLFYIGFPPAMVGLFAAITAAWQLWIHTEQVKTIGPFEWVLNTASHHRVHHATNPCYLDRNHGGFLIIWDRMFGTFAQEREDEPCRYGIVSNLGSFNLFTIAFHEWAAIGRDLRSARTFGEAFGYVFGPPGWSPDGSRQTSDSIRAEWSRQQAAMAPAE